jgi:hypothetical protein
MFFLEITQIRWYGVCTKELSEQEQKLAFYLKALLPSFDTIESAKIICPSFLRFALKIGVFVIGKCRKEMNKSQYTL